MTGPDDLALRRGHVGDFALGPHLMRVNREALRLLAEQPHLDTQSAEGLRGRVMTPETAPDFESFLRRAAFAVLAVRAKDREEQASPFTGDAA